MLPVGTRIGRGEPDYCRRCKTITRHAFFVASHERWLCDACGEEHESEACGWSCVECGEESNAFVRLVVLLAIAGLEPERRAA